MLLKPEKYPIYTPIHPSPLLSSQPLNSQAIEQKQEFLRAPSSSNLPHLPRNPTSPSLPPTLTPTQLPSQPQNPDPVLQSAPKSRSRLLSRPNSQFNPHRNKISDTSTQSSGGNNMPPSRTPLYLPAYKNNNAANKQYQPLHRAKISPNRENGSASCRAVHAGLHETL